MFKTDIPIVVVAYNRPKSLKRLLSSIDKAYYPSSNVPLVISIDAANDNQDVLKMAQDFVWTHGEKKVSYQNTNLGLRKHIIKCANLSLEYGAVIILEDDLYVSCCFYEYAIAALNFSVDKPYIGGISLYNNQLNVHTKDNFSAIEDGFDNWYFQFASSWGQAWTANQWQSFLDWYDKTDALEENSDIPLYVASWSEKSWLKYFIAYLIFSNKYFFYPRISLSTNFSDAGTHIGNDSTKFQVPLLFSKSPSLKFSSLNESFCVYDSFYENEKLHYHLNLVPADLSVDLYGHKPNTNKRYFLTNKKLNYKIMRSFGKSLKPIDANILENIEGAELFLYDTRRVETNPHSQNHKRDILYNIKGLSYRKATYLAVQLLKDRFLKLLKLK